MWQECRVHPKAHPSEKENQIDHLKRADGSETCTSIKRREIAAETLV